MSHVRFRTVIPCLLVALALAGTLSVLTAPDARACTCQLPPSPEAALDQSEEVFAGEVVEIHEVPGGVAIRFSVSEVWKGVEHQQIEVATPRGGEAACGYEFTEGQEYLVYSTENQSSGGPETATGLCHRTTALADAGEDLNALGEGTPGSSLTPIYSTDDGSDTGVPNSMRAWLLGGLAMLIGATLMGFRLLRR